MQNDLKEFLNEFKSIIFNAPAAQQKHTMDECIQLYLANAAIRTRPDTLEFYKKNFKTLMPIFYELKLFYIEDLTIPKLTEIIAKLKERGRYKNNTLNKFIDQVKGLNRYCYLVDILESDKISKFRKLPKDDVETITIKLDIIRKIFEYMDSLNLDDPITLRNVLFVHLCNDTGARMNELRNIKLENLRLEQNQIYLTFTKTKVNRYVSILDSTKALILKYIDLVKPKDYILCNVKTKEQLDRSNLYTFLKSIKTELNITQSISPHKWRHTLASNLLKHHLNIRQIQSVLGHTSLDTTKKYLHLNNSDEEREELEEALRQINSGK